MNKRYINILSEIEVFAKHELSSSVIKTLKVGELISYNREKRRKGINWMEVYLDDNRKGYIKKDLSKIFICEKVILSADNATGFNFEHKSKTLLPIDQLFFQKGHFKSSDSPVGNIDLRSVNDVEKGDIVSLNLEYLKDVVDVKGFRFIEGQDFHILYKSPIFIEINDFKGKKGFLLSKTETTDPFSKGLGYLAIVIVVLTVIALFAAFLASGWLVVSGLMILAGVVVAVILIFVIQLTLMILIGIFKQIRKRL